MTELPLFSCPLDLSLESLAILIMRHRYKGISMKQTEFKISCYTVVICLIVNNQPAQHHTHHISLISLWVYVRMLHQ